MTVSSALLLAIIIALGVKMRGVQMPHVLLGMIFAASLTPGSTVDDLNLQALEAFNAVVDAVAQAFGQSGVV